jgi:uncharacterized protein YjbI with pentapeptide repeats
VQFVIVRNRLGEEIDRVQGCDLWTADLSKRDWRHADLSGMGLFGANCEGINLWGARLVGSDFSRANLRGAELAYSDATRACFRGANLDGTLMYRSETRGANFDGANISPASDVPGIRIVGDED